MTLCRPSPHPELPEGLSLISPTPTQLLCILGGGEWEPLAIVPEHWQEAQGGAPQ